MTMVVENRYQLFRCSHVLCLVCTGDSQDLRTCQLHPWDKIGHIRKQCWSEPQVARRLIPRIPRWSFSKQKRLWKTQKIHKNSRFPWCLVFQTSRNLVNPVNPSLESTWLPSFPLRELLELWLVPSDKIRRVGTLGLMRARPKLVGGMGEMRRRSVGILPFIGRGDRDFRSPHFKNYPKCLDGAKRQRCWASEVHKIHRVRANSHMCTI